MLAPSNAVIEDTWECLGGGFDGRGQFGFVRVGNQFGNSPFYSGAAWVWFFFWRMYGLPTLSFFFPILYEEKLELLFADISGSDFRRGVFCGNRYIVVVYSLLILFALRKERMCEC
jgi:hypothetical protein